jgi:hypothetical protein
MPDPKTIAEYKEAYENWQKQLEAVHSLLIEGQRIPPIQIKGLLNRESRWKRRYDRARLKLLGIEEEPDAGDEDGDDDAT